VIDFEGSGDADENEGGLTLDPEADQAAGETETAPDSHLAGELSLEEEQPEEGGELSLEMSEETGTGEDQGALLDLTMGGAPQADEDTDEEAGEASGGLSLELETEEDQPGAEAPSLSLESIEEGPQADSGSEQEGEGGQATVFVPRSAESGEQSAEDEMATKLDLAKAYVELGDKDSAKNILEEIINDGSEEQRRQAQELLSQVS
jgi:pilus assembly protein FimV